MNIKDIASLAGFNVKKEHQQTNNNAPGSEEKAYEKPKKKEVFLQWSAPIKLATKNISPKFSRTLLIIGVSFGLLLIVMQEYFMIFALLSIVFFLYVIKKFDIGEAKFEISNYGITYDERLYEWPDLKQFFFVKEGTAEMLVVDTLITLPPRLLIKFNASDKPAITKYLEEYLTLVEEPSKNFMDKTYDKVVDKLNIEGE